MRDPASAGRGVPARARDLRGSLHCCSAGISPRRWRARSISSSSAPASPRRDRCCRRRAEVPGSPIWGEVELAWRFLTRAECCRRHGIERQEHGDSMIGHILRATGRESRAVPAAISTTPLARPAGPRRPGSGARRRAVLVPARNRSRPSNPTVAVSSSTSARTISTATPMPFEAYYARAKARLLDVPADDSGYAILNADDPASSDGLRWPTPQGHSAAVLDTPRTREPAGPASPTAG